MIKFPHTIFSVFGIGNANYNVEFSCEGTTNISHNIFVKSRIETIQFAIIPPPSIEVLHPSFNEYHHIFSLLILDNKGNPVQGKVP